MALFFKLLIAYIITYGLFGLISSVNINVKAGIKVNNFYTAFKNDVYK